MVAKVFILIGRLLLFMRQLRYFYNYICKKIQHDFWDETRHIRNTVKNNDRNGKTYYIIRRQGSFSGMFSNYVFVLGHIKYALSNGWVPVIDMKYYKTLYTNPYRKGIENSWDYFFEQPCKNDTLDMAYKSKNFILSSGDIIEDMPNLSSDFLYDKKLIKSWKKYVNMITIHEHILSYIDNEFNKMFSGIETSQILGVLLRGTDYINLKPKLHPIQPSVEDAVKVIDRMIYTLDCKYIYLVTEDEYILDEMKRIYGNDKLLYSEVSRYNHNLQGYIAQNPRQSKDDYIKKGLDYLIPIGVLSRLNNLFAGRTSGTIGTLLLSDSISNYELWDVGEYK